MADTRDNYAVIYRDKDGKLGLDGYPTLGQAILRAFAPWEQYAGLTSETIYLAKEGEVIDGDDFDKLRRDWETDAAYERRAG